MKTSEKYRKKPLVVEAIQWFRNGDHPADETRMIQYNGEEFLSEGKIVRRFRRPDIPGEKICSKCHTLFDLHGFIETLEGGQIVCVGDYIIKGTAGEYYPCKPDIFENIYEKIRH